MIDTIALISVTLFSDPFIAFMFCALTFFVLFPLFIKGFVGFLKLFLISGYIIFLSSVYYISVKPADKEVVEELSKITCNSSHFNVNDDFNEFYNSSDKTLKTVEAKYLFIIHRKCLAEKHERTLLENS